MTVINSEDNEEYKSRLKKTMKSTAALFYQYRPCRRDDFTIYDIENIRHGVVYAQSPLNMNDPFDSKIGFSQEKLYDELIELVLDTVDIDDNLKSIIGVIVKFDLLDDLVTLLTALNDLKKQIAICKKTMHQDRMSYNDFFLTYNSKIYDKLPKQLKKLFNKQVFQQFGKVIGLLGELDVTEENIKELLGSKEQFDVAKKLILELRDNKYIPLFNEFLSKLNVSCFSASGWNNGLMWSHYANHYSGICVEYDFSDCDKLTALFNRVTYSKTRPTISLKDFGLTSIEKTESGEYVFNQGDINILQIINYLCVKDTIWEREQEWRFIDSVSTPNSYSFIEVPKIKSITFGVNVDPLCRQLLLDVCDECKIECYELILGTGDFFINRKKIESVDGSTELDITTKYIDILLKDISDKSKKMNPLLTDLKNMQDSGIFNIDYLVNSNQLVIDLLSDAYYLKMSVNRSINNFPEAIIECDMDSLREDVQNIDDVINEMKCYTSSIRECYNVLLRVMYIREKEKISIEKQLFRLDSLISKYLEKEWSKLIMV